MEQSVQQPLCVDLDGTLVRTNTLFEAALSAIKKNVWVIFPIAAAGLTSKAAVKHTIGIYSVMDSKTLPYNEEFLAWLKKQHAQGRKLILATASDKSIADAVAQHLGIFQEVIASTPKRPISAANKYKVLTDRFGTKKFSYAGNSDADITVWKCAASAIIVDATDDISRKVHSMVPLEAEFSSENTLTPHILLKTLRSHQWVKNLLLFTAPIAAHRIGDIQVLLDTTIALVAFSCIASSIYIFNDVFDLPSDRAHATKRFRPIAAGNISLFRAAMLAVSMALVGIIIAFLFLPNAFLGILVLYMVITSAYSLRLKKIPYIDIAVLAGLYVLRVIAGSAATSIPTSKWLFLFAACLFVSLGIAKRVTELSQLTTTESAVIGRGYTKRDKELLTALGLTSALFACIVIWLYATSPGVALLYSHPSTLFWMIPIFGLWTIHMWKHAITGSLHEDPVLFAMKDYGSYAAIAALAIILMVAL